MAPGFSQEDSDLIASLHALSAKQPKLVRSSAYSAPADASIQVRSWKMNEFKYYDIPSPFPTLARGLFTRELKDDEFVDAIPNDSSEEDGANVKKGKRYQIVVRGYDKFFNIGEVPWTTWTSIESHTAPPYTLSLKSNGCIIFIAALTPTKLVITSKHSLGPVEAAEVSHAQAGEAWLRKYLAKLNKKEEDIAAELWDKNWTAVAELCDDSFEEHVLGYPPEKTGLHLHGLNVRSKEFNTMPTEQVDAFAERWGFIKTPTITFNTIQEVKDFTASCAETGEWNGEQVEGFVVRTHVTEPPTSGRNTGGKEKEDGASSGGGGNGGARRSPYKAGSSFFFKVKFDEPYMMYRDWREVTKSLLSSKGEMSASNLPKSKMKRPETQLYVKWVINEIKTNRAAFKDYAKGKGIIATREKYLAWMKSDKGEQELQELEKKVEKSQTGPKHFDKTIIVPIAIPGCGKTAVSVALAHIFGFAHTQSDDIHVKKAGPAFIKNVKALLEKNNVVIADKNNHLTQHREALRVVAEKDFSSVRLLALNWSLDRPPAMVHRICGDRVLGRGENHQTLRADPSAARTHEEVIWMFIQSYEELVPSEVDEIIEMDLDDTLEHAVRRAVEGCVRILGVPQPTEEKIAEALEVVNNYEPATKKPDDPKAKSSSKSGSAQRYFGLLPEIDIVALLDKRLEEADVDEELKAFWKELKENGRVTRRPHVTIVHKNNKETEKELWDRCTALHAMTVSPPTFKGTLTRVVCNERVMALTVGDFGVEDPGESEGQEGYEFVSKLPEEVRNRLHITVGTQKESIPAVEAMGLVKLLKEKGESAETKVAELKDVTFRARVKGLNS